MALLEIPMLALATFIIETTLLHYVEIGGIKPDLILIVVIYSSFAYTESRALTIGFIFGLIQDSLSHGIFGLQAMLKTITVLIIVLLQKNFLSENPTVEYLLSFAAILSNCFLFVYITQTFAWVNPDPLHWDKILVMALYNSFTLPFVYLFINKTKLMFNSKTGKQQRQ